MQALNADMPYDRFVALQLAGDELEPGDRDALIATGFGRCGPREVVGGNVIPEVKRQNELTEITGTVGSVFLGLTIGCARCHDHKFDAIPVDRLLPAPVVLRGRRSWSTCRSPRRPELEAFEAAKKAVEQKAAPLRKQLAALEAPYRKALAEQKHAMLTADERAVMAIPEKNRTPAQKRLAQGLQNVAAGHLGGGRRGRRGQSRRPRRARGAEAGDRRDRADAAASSRPCHGAGRPEGRRLPTPSSSAAATTATRARRWPRGRRA